MDIIKKEFGKNLKAHRRAAKLTQERFAEKIGVNLRQLARIEAGESFISSETLYNICDTLRISPKILFDFKLNEKDKNENRNLKDIKLSNQSEIKELIDLRNKLNKISDDKQKLEYLNLAFDSIYSKKAVKELKILIKGIELAQSIIG